MPLPDRNHNPRWLVDTAEGKRLRVYGCDERQVIDYVVTALALTVVAVVRISAQD